MHFHGGRLPAHELVQKADPIGIDTDMTPPVARVHIDIVRVRLLAEGIAMPGDRRPREIQGAPVAVEHHLADVGVEQIDAALDGLAQGGHAALRVGGQVLRHLVDHGGRDQRLVALHIDHDVVVGQAQLLGHFLQPVRAGGMIGAGHHHLALVAHGVADALVVGGHQHPRGAAFSAAFRHPGHHRPAGQIRQRFSRQARRRVPRRHYHIETHSCPY